MFLTIVPQVDFAFARFAAAARRLAIVATFAVAASIANAQQFVEDSTLRFPQPDPLEYSEQVDFADVDNDGDLDVLFANGAGYAGPEQQQLTRLLINNGIGIFTDESAARLGGTVGYTRDVELADVDHDGDVDLLQVNTFNTQSRLFINNGAGIFANETATRLPTANFSGSDADFGDIDNDGDLDLIFTNTGTTGFGSGVDRLYLNNGAGVFSDGTVGRTPGTAAIESIDCDFFDMDGDLDLDLLMGHRNTPSQLWRNNGSGVYSDVTAANLPSTGSGTYSVDLGDINGDGDLDLLVTRGSTDMVFQNNGSGVFSVITGTALPTNPNQDDNDGEFVDIDNDGDLDMAIARLGSGGERIYVNNGSGVLTLSSGLITVISDSSLDIEFGDLTGDGRIDIVTAQGESGSFRNRLYVNVTGPADSRPPTFHATTQLPDTTSTIGPYVVRSTIRDNMTSDNNFFDRGITLWYRVGTGLPNAQPMRYSGGDLYRGTIPGLAAGSSVTYWITATDWAGNTGTSTERSFNVTGSILGDWDGDGDIDLNDLAAFIDCAGGPGGGVDPGCATFDMDGDADVDFLDFSLFQLAYSAAH